VNNVVVCTAYGLFWWMRRGEEPGLDLTAGEIAVLAGGTTLGVIAFCALPIVGARRSGFRFRPNLDRTDPALRLLARQGAWAALYLAMTQVFLGAVLVFANRSEGGVIAYQVGFTFFLLPHLLFALPVLTTLFPAAARHVHAGRWVDVRATVRRGTTAIALFVLPSAVALGVLAEPLARVASFGNVGPGGTELIADVVRGFAPGLVGYALFYFLTRMLYAMGDTRTPATVHAAVVALGVAAMAVAAATLDGDRLVAALAWAHSGTYLVGALVLGTVASGRLRHRGVPVRLPAALGPQLGGAAVALAATAGVVAATDAPSRLGSLGIVVLGGVAAAGTHVAVQSLLGGPRPMAIVGLLRGGPAVGADAP
jgi:putative peptidoglycan lipid II flippase